MTFTRVYKILISLIILSLSLGQLGRINVGTHIVGIYIWDILIVIFLLLYLFTKKSVVNLKSAPMFYRLLCLFLIWCIVPAINSIKYIGISSDFMISVSYLIRLMAYTLFGFVLFVEMRNKLFLKTIIVSSFVTGLIISLLGFIQLILFPDLSKLDVSLMWDPHKNRLVSTLLDPNFTSIILLICLSFGLLLLKQYRGKKILLGMLVILCAIFLTYSRSGWLALGVFILIIGALRYRWLLLVSFLLFFSSYFFVPRIQTRLVGITDPSDSFYHRFESWNNALTVINQEPLIGLGYNSYRYIQSSLGLFDYNNDLGNRSGAGVDSSLLLIWATTGILGLSIYLFWYLFSLIYMLISYLKRRDFDWLIGVSLFSGLLLNSQFINSLLYPQVVILMLLFFNAIYFNQSCES